MGLVSVAELAKADDFCISPDMFNETWRNISTYKWPNQPKPTKNMFKSFYNYIRRSLYTRVKHHVKKEHLNLDKRPGRWYPRRRHSRDEW